MPKLVVIIPTYNEAKNITPIIKRLHEFVPTAQVLVADDNSPDGTGDIVRKLAAEDPRITLFARKGKEGLGKAYIAAFNEALKDSSVEWIQMLDADFSHDPKYMPNMLEKSKDFDVVIGSRYVHGGGTSEWPLRRRLLSRFANLYCRTITGMPINDTTAGFILMRTSFMRKAQLNEIRASGHAFMMELKYRLWKNGARIIEVPTILEDRQQGVSKMSQGVIAEAVKAPWKMRFGKNVGIPKEKIFTPEFLMLAFIILGSFVGIWLGLPMLNIVGDEQYYVGGVLRAIQAHSILPLPGDVPYGTLTFYVNYCVQLPFLGLLLVWKGFKLSSMMTFLVLNPAVNYIVPRFVSAVVASLFALYYNRTLRNRGIPLLQRFAVLATLFFTVISAVMLHTGKMWVLTMVLVMMSLLYLWRALSLGTTDLKETARLSVWSIFLASCAFANFPLAAFFLVNVPILLWVYRQERSFCIKIIKTTLLGACIPLFIFIINYTGIIGDIVGFFTLFHPLVKSNIPQLSFIGSIKLHALQLLLTFPITLVLLGIAVAVRAIRDKLLFWLSVGYAALFFIVVAYSATWYFDTGEMLRYFLAFGFFFSGMVASLDFKKMRSFFVVFCVLQVAIYFYVLYLIASPFTFNIADTYITQHLSQQPALIYVDVPELTLPQNEASSVLTQERFCGTKCAYLRSKSVATSFAPTVITYQSQLSNVVPANYPEIYWVSGNSLAGTCAGAPIATFQSGASDAQYEDIEYNLGNYFSPDFWHLSHLGKNIYLYKVSASCMWQLPRKVS